MWTMRRVVSAIILPTVAAQQLSGFTKNDELDFMQASMGRWPSGAQHRSNSSVESPPSADEFPIFTSGVPEYDQAYQLATSELLANTVAGAFVAGAGWGKVWTRDTSYSVQLATGLVSPVTSKKSIQGCTEQDRQFGQVWLQDECSHFGRWPQLSDSIVGAQGAWNLFVVTGDTSFLSWAYDVTKNSLKRAERDAFDESSKLFGGCSSFMESNSGYPHKYHNRGDLVAKTKALSTNVLYYNGYKSAALMGRELGANAEEIETLNEKADQLRTAIHQRLWLADKGYYSYFEDAEGQLTPQMEGLGESLLLLADDLEPNKSRIESILAYDKAAPLKCLWPPFEHKENEGDIFARYHNGRVWPFVQAYFAIAAARHKKENVFGRELESLVRLSRTTHTFAEFYEPGQGARAAEFAVDLSSYTHPHERRRQLWSDAGFLGMIYQGLFGMTFTARGVKIEPVKPARLFPAQISLRNLRYREAIFHIQVSGSGSQVASFLVNGKAQEAFLPSDVKGEHNIEIEMTDGVVLASKNAGIDML